jgi:pimeloyl-ACP methyl ester carboxylesterase
MRRKSRCTMMTLVAVAMTSLATPILAQNIRFELPNGPEIHAAISKLPADQQAAIGEATKKVFPLFVFIPGIMGSRLTKTLANGNTKVIWGQGVFNAPDPDLAYAEGDSVKAEVMDEYFAANTTVNVYGEALKAIRFMDFSKGDNVRLFAYDWRQSNAKSARDFAAWLCKNRDEFKSRPLVLMAHSMGGLVLKSWLKNIYESEGCSGAEKFSSWVKIKKVFFFGTPHYGAPKAVMAFGDQYSILFDTAETAIGRWLTGRVDVAVLSRSINLYGATFPSAYELLPVINTNECFKDSKWPSPVSVRQSNGTVHSDLDLFNASMWKVLNWPKHLGPGIDRSKFTAESLPRLLDSAKSFLCDLSGFKPDEKLDVVRVYGNKRSTICNVTINEPAAASDPVTVTPEFCRDEDEGDGTVPKWVASEDRYSNVDKRRSSLKSHMWLVGSPEFLAYLTDYKAELHREVDKKYGEAVGNFDGIVKMYASLRTILPSGSAAEDPDGISRQIARRVVETLGVAPTTIYKAAKSEPDAVTRANAYRVFADVAVPNDPARAWAFNNAAHIYLGQKDFVSARNFGKLSVKTADEGRNSKSIGAYYEIMKRAGSTTAVAAEQLNDLDTADMFRKVADDPYASKNLRQYWNLNGT